MTAREVSYQFSESRRLLSLLGEAASSDGANPKSFALLLRRIDETQAFVDEGFRSFHAYLTTPTPRGLGMTENQFLRIADLGGEGKRARWLLYGHDDEELQLPKLGKIGRGRGRVDNINSNGGGTGESYTIRRLKRDRPDLAEAVLNGQLSANAAAIQAGFRRRKISVPVDSAEDLAANLARHLDPEQIAQLIRHLEKSL